MFRCILLVLLAATALSAQIPAPMFKRELLVGYWKVNWDKSRLQNAAPVSQLPGLYRRYEEHGDGFMLHTVIAVAPAGQAAQLQLLAAVKYDSREYPTYTPERLTDLLTTGKKAVETVAFKVVDALNLEWTDRTNGKLTGTGTVALSQDGKTMTDTTRNFNPEGKETAMNVFVYEKQ